jgi:hypothetical protein
VFFSVFVCFHLLLLLGKHGGECAGALAGTRSVSKETELFLRAGVDVQTEATVTDIPSRSAMVISEGARNAR